MKRIKVGVAGGGWISDTAHISTMKNSNCFIVKSLYDKNESLLEEMREKWGIDDTFVSLLSFLNSDIDAVVIATPNFTHKHLIISALLREKWVLCEKPLVLNTAELNEIKSTCPKNYNHIIPAFVNSFRFDIKQLFNELGTIGELKKIEGKWIRKNGIPRPGTWFTNKNLAGGGVLIDLGPHILNICLDIIQTFVEEQSMTVEIINTDSDYLTNSNFDNNEASWFSRNETTNIIIDVEKRISSKLIINGVEVCLDLDWANESQDDFTQFTVYGSKGYVRLNTLFGFSTCRKYNTAELLVVRGGTSKIRNINNNLNTQLYAFQEMYAYLENCIRSESSGALDLNMGEKVVKVIDKIYECLEGVI